MLVEDATLFVKIMLWDELGDGDENSVLETDDLGDVLEDREDSTVFELKLEGDETVETVEEIEESSVLDCKVDDEIRLLDTEEDCPMEEVVYCGIELVSMSVEMLDGGR